MSDYHEPSEELTEDDRDLHRALVSLKEEIEAVDWYHQRVSRAKDDALRSVLAHNRDEEVEHACMTLEWLRRRVPAWHRHLSTYLFSEGDIVGIEGSDGLGEAESGLGLGIGGLSATDTAGPGMAGLTGKDGSDGSAGGSRNGAAFAGHAPDPKDSTGGAP